MGINREMRDGTLILENTENGACVEIRETVSEECGCVAPKGELSGEVAHDLEDELTAIALACSNVILDMSEVSLVSNAVLRSMLDVQHMIDALGGELTIRGVGPRVLSRFEEMGLDGVFEIEQSRQMDETQRISISQ